MAKEEVSVMLTIDEWKQVKDLLALAVDVDNAKSKQYELILALIDDQLE